MSIIATRKVTVYLMMALAFLALQFSLEISPLVVPLFWAGAAASWMWEPPRVQMARWAPTWTWLTVGVFGFTIVDVFVLGEFFLISAMNFVLFLATAKLFQRAEDKDYTQAMGLSLMLLTAGAVLNDRLSFGFIFACYVLVATLGLTVQHLCLEVAEHHGSRGRTMRVERAVVASTLLLGTLVLAGSAGFFFAFPRIGFGFLAQQSRGGVTTSGFNDRVQLGEHGTIRENTTIVMRVSFPNGPPAPVQTIHWRGLSLDRYDGRSWSDNDDVPLRVTRFDDGSGYAILGRDQTSTWAEAVEGTVVAEINLEPLESDVLFSIGRMRALQLPFTLGEIPDSAFGRELTVDSTGEVNLHTRSSLGVRYVIYSDPMPTALPPDERPEWPLGAADLGDAVWQAYLATLPPETTPPERPRQLDDATIAQAVRGDSDSPFRPGARLLATSYLQLPDDIVTDRMVELTSRLRAENPDAYDYAVAVEAYLRTQLGYTTDLPEPSGRDANLVDEFLFEWERGHCEYFATAMVVMLRQQGIPARIVNGFLGGDYNSVGDFYAVRQANAHSWVEANLGARRDGWMEFDPTPAGAASAGPTGWSAKLSMAIDSLRLKWFRWVVEYDLEKQADVARDLAARLSGGGDSFETMERMRRWAFSFARNFFAMSLLGLPIIACSLFYRRRGQARIPWAALDSMVGIAWAGTALAIVQRYWSGGFTTGGLIAALVPPAIGVFVAYQLRRDLFATDDDRRSRSGGKLEVSIMYASLLRAIERDAEDLPISVTADELVPHLALVDRAVEAELAAFVAFYRRARFSGRGPGADELERWRKAMPGLRRRLRAALRATARAREMAERQAR